MIGLLHTCSQTYRDLVFFRWPARKEKTKTKKETSACYLTIIIPQAQMGYESIGKTDGEFLVLKFWRSEKMFSRRLR